ncbi:MAG: SDR family NAD(P)-dependent oxidoreductase [Bacteroidota bacterium]
MHKKPVALITGASSGIGAATARSLSKTYNLVICGRRVDRLENLASELPCEVFTMSFDVRDEEEVSTNINALPPDWSQIDVLINNAGNAHGLDYIQDGSSADWDAMIDINVKGLLYVTQAILPGMVARKKGHVINIGSIAGLEVYPKGNVYCASKHAVDALTKGMRLDLNEHGIKVSSVNPGLVETEFSEVRFKGDKERAASIYQNYDPLQAEDIADTIEFILSRPDHVVIGDLLILPVAQANSTTVNKKPAKP